MNIKTKMLILTCIFAVIAAVMYFFYETEWCFTLAIVASTTFYHLAIRLFVRWIVNVASKRRYNYNNAWFKEKKGERKFYKMIGVHGWKSKFPPYEPKDFDIKNGVENIIQATCVTEIAHTIIIVLSYLPLVIAAIWGDVTDIIIFAVTSFVAGLVDFLIVVVQRYNRPRLIGALKWSNRKQKTTV